MSKMHHRREGYPFGSLVDFAPDRMGRKSLNLSCVFSQLLITLQLLLSLYAEISSFK